GTFLPYVLEYCMNNPDENDKTTEILGKFAKQIGWANWDMDTKKAAYVVIDKINELQKEIGFPHALHETHVSRADLENNLDKLVSLCFQSPVCTAGPRSPRTEEWKKLFIYAYDGKNVDF
ncbi:MAG: iron-containing alcohol dehydrogenase, partial [Promethearchaeota archaeon]